MVSVTTESLPKLLLRLSEASPPVILWGRQARQHFGRDFDRLLGQRLLVEQEPAREWPVCATCDCDADARPVEYLDGRPVAVCPADRRADTVLDPADLRAFEVNVGVLVQAIAAATGIPAPTEVLPGVWHMGLSSGRAVFLIPSLAAAQQPALLTVLRNRAGNAQITMLTATLPASDAHRLEDAGVLQHFISDVIGSDDLKPFAIDLSRLVQACRHAPRLVISDSLGTTVLDGREILLPGQPHRLLVLLAERVVAGRPTVSIRDIEARTNRVARDVVRELRDSLAGGQPNSGAIRDLIRNRRNPPSYSLGLSAEDIDLRP